jgi:catalase-peroxidase
MRKIIITSGLILSLAFNIKAQNAMASKGKCPFGFDSKTETNTEAPAAVIAAIEPEKPLTNNEWWPNQSDLSVLRKNSNL